MAWRVPGLDLAACGAVPGRGEAAFEPRSRRPKTSLTARTAALEAELAALKAKQIEGPVHHHVHFHGVTPKDATATARATISTRD